jgi:hypothetical protein
MTVLTQETSGANLTFQCRINPNRTGLWRRIDSMYATYIVTRVTETGRHTRQHRRPQTKIKRPEWKYVRSGCPRPHPPDSRLDEHDGWRKVSRAPTKATRTTAHHFPSRRQRTSKGIKLSDFCRLTYLLLQYLTHIDIVTCNIFNSMDFCIIKPTRYTNFSNLFLERNSTCFGQFLCPSSGVFHCTNSNGICHTGLLTACEQDQDETEI